MGRNTIPWVELGCCLMQEQADVVFQNQKPRKIERSQEADSCTVCMSARPHKMQYQLLKCASQTCEEAATASVRCKWRGKVLTCAESGLISIYEVGEHLTKEADQYDGSLTDAQKRRARKLASEGFKPQRILRAIAQDTPADQVPNLQKLQNFVTHYKKSKLYSTNATTEDNTEDNAVVDNKDADELDVIEKLIKTRAFSGYEDDAEPFSFSNKRQTDGTPAVGEGTDADPFLVGYTTKTLLKRLDRDPASFVFHMDGACTLNEVSYPIFVCGISDPTRSFHLVAMFVSSEKEEAHYAAALKALRAIYMSVMSKPLALRYVMGTGDVALNNAIASVFQDWQLDMLTCFHHVVSQVHEHTKRISSERKSSVVAEVFDLQCTRSASEFYSKKTATVRRWLADPDVEGFALYFFRQWLKGSSTKWQCFHTPMGCTTTSEPVEKFVGALSLALHSRMKVGVLLRCLEECCRNESLNCRAFQSRAVASSELRSRAAELRRSNIVIEIPPLESGGEINEDFMLVLSREAPPMEMAAKGQTADLKEVAAQFGENDARMERHEQPEAGWAVDLKRMTCPCTYFYKYGQCVHVLFALDVRPGSDRPQKRTLFNRSTTSKKQKQNPTQKAQRVSP